MACSRPISARMRLHSSPHIDTRLQSILIFNSCQTHSVRLAGKASARRACRILEAKKVGFFVPSPEQRQQLLIECAVKGYAIYAKAFDILKVTETGLRPEALDIKKHFASIQICEIKSTNRELGEDWRSYFFSLSTAELLIAQSLQEKFRFVLVNTRNGHYLQLTLTEVFARARAIYPSWSVRF